jgi:HK97 family phage prohead protease
MKLKRKCQKLNQGEGYMKESIKLSSLTPFMDTNGLDQESEVLRKRFSSKISISPEEERTVVSVISCTTEDADNDCILPTGADLKRFQSNPVVLFGHNYSSKPIAKIVALSVTEDAITAKMQFADTQEALECWSLVKGGFLSACSIGFIIKEAYYAGTEEFKQFVKANKIKVKDTVRRIISKFELLENSLVPIPSNPDALVQAVSSKSIVLSDKMTKELDLPKVVVIEKTVEAPVEADMTPGILPLDSNMLKEETIKEANVASEVKTIVVQPEVVEVVVQPIPEPVVEKKYLKVIRNGSVNIEKMVELKRLAKKGRIV